MGLTHWGFIYTSPGLEAGPRTTIVQTDACRTVLVG